jgi:GTP-binding protein
MAFIDEVRFFARAGRGGDGVVRWRREKFRPKGGPAGGDGGDGGDFYVKAIRDITALRRIAQKDTYEAEDGEAGKKNSMHGRNGTDFYLELPVGSVITRKDTGEHIELLEDGETQLLLKGGEGGLGNEHFKSSTNQQPMQATKGKEGEEGNFYVELKLIADIGLIGLPNAGKTSLLNALTNAGARVGDYPFTTLDPNLGVYFKYIIADIPGLIEGASEGKGLGHKFLRHIARTNVILHCISLERESIKDDFIAIQKEIDAYPDISRKNQYILLTKSDTVEKEDIEQAKNTLNDITDVTILGIVSILDDDSIKILGDALVQILEQ